MEDGGSSRHLKACITCAKAKVRCLPEINGPCKRCKRLGKECGNQTPGTHRRQRKPGTGNSDVAALEAKLDRMVALLAASDQNARERLEGATTTRSSSTYEEQPTAPGVVDDKTVLEIFTERMLPLFPFLMIPSHVTADELRREKPFLFLNISMVATLNSARQRELVKTVQRYVAEHIVIKGEHSLDLLQGLLVNVAWFVSRSQHPNLDAPGAHKLELEPQHMIRSTCSLDTFVHLLVAQSLTLGLNQELTYQKSLNYPITYLREGLNEELPTPVRTLEQRRTYLGCYYLTTMLSTCVKDLGPIIRFTKYTEECCKALDEAAEYPSDAFVVQLVRVMNLAERIHHTLYHTEIHSSSVSSPPLGLSIKWLEAELKQLKSRMSCDPPHAATLLTHYDTLEIHLYRVALNHDSSDSNYGDHPLMRLDLLFRCLETTTSFFRNFYAMPSVLFPYVPFSIVCQFGKAIVTLSQLSLYNHDGWDRTYVESTIDFNQTVDHMVAKVEESSHCAGAPEIFERMTSRAKMMKLMHRRRKEALERTSTPSAMDSMNYELMMNTPLDLLFPFGEAPPIYELYNSQP